MKKYLKIWWRLMSINWQTEMMYRYDFLAVSISQFLFQFVGIGFLYFLFQSNGGINLAELSVYDYYLIYAISNLLIGVVYMFVLPSAMRMKQQIYKGYFDHMLIKPKSWFMVQFQRSWAPGGLQIIFYQLILFYLVHDKVSFEWSWTNIGIIIFVFWFSIAMQYLIYWNVVYLYFFYPKFDVGYKFVRNSESFNRFPAKLYPRTMQFVFSFIVPVFLIINPIYKLIDQTLDLKYIGGMMLVLVVFGLINVWMWREGIRRYESVT